jgi:FMN phosphatase YigB (HAD superfamily)
MHVLLDLDGTLVDTNASKFDDIKCGRDRNFDLSDIPIASGAHDFVTEIKRRGHSVTIVSDSHAAYVGPVSDRVFETPWFALADKPNTPKLRAFLQSRFGFPLRSLPEEYLFVGDTKLDTQLARGLSLPSALLFRGVDDAPNHPYNNKDAAWAQRYKWGATYNCRSFENLLNVIEYPAKQRLALEDPIGTAFARFYTGKNLNDGYTLVRGLGRQQQGACDAYGAIHRYNRFGSEDRDENFLLGIAQDVSRYLRTEVFTRKHIRWDMITCVADKAATKPPRKMAELLHALDVGLSKEELFNWSLDVKGSIRQEKKRADRIAFIKKFVRLDSRADLTDKNVIVIDDQYTTGATAMSHVDLLLDAGVRNVLFLALFYLADEVPTEKTCPNCGKPMSIKYNKRDGSTFYSCVPPTYNGNGCGERVNIAHG